MSEKMRRIPLIVKAFYMTGIWRKFVLKGGTSIALFYFPNFRISVDLDYVIYEDSGSYRDLEYYVQLLQKIGGYLEEVYSGIFGKIEISRERGGIKGKVPIVVERGTVPKINLDITFGKYNKIFLSPEDREMLVPGFEGVYARVMCINEIYAEKIRSLFQRTQIRDLYDVYFLSEYIKDENVSELVKDKFEMLRGIDFDIDRLINKRESFMREYPHLLKYTNSPPTFEIMWKKVIRILNEIEETIKRDSNLELSV